MCFIRNNGYFRALYSHFLRKFFLLFGSISPLFAKIVTFLTNLSLFALSSFVEQSRKLAFYVFRNFIKPEKWIILSEVADIRQEDRKSEEKCEIRIISRFYGKCLFDHHFWQIRG